MDIKLKNNKVRSFLAACIIVMAAAIGYLSMYPEFSAQAKYKIKDSTVQDEMWLKICQSNYILYKNIQESVQGSRLSYEDVYLQVVEEELSEEEIQSAYDSEYVWEPNEVRQSQEGMLYGLPEWENEMLTGLYQQIDYCVIDNQSGKLLKNTDRGLDKLQSGNTAENPYKYFIRMDYDTEGSLQNVSVTGPESDKVLKYLQAQGQGNSLLSQKKTFYVNDGRRIEVQIKRPAATTFLYGITEEQWDSMYGSELAGNNIPNSWWWEQYNAYSSTGLQGFYLLFLCAVMLIALLMPKLFKSYSLQENRWTRIPFEAASIILIFLFSAADMVVTLVVRSANDMLLQTWNRVMPQNVAFGNANYPGYLILKFLINLLPLFLLFAAGYWTAASFGIVWNKGIRGYFAKRSIIYNFCSHTKGFWKNKYKQVKDELQSVDLNKNTDKIIGKYVILNFILLALLSSMWIFGIGVLLIYTVILFLMIRKYISNLQTQYRELLKVTDSIAQGNLNTPMSRNLGVFNAYQERLARIQSGFKKAVDEEVKSQRMKTELITNVSHDLKTPLTAIITYIDLLKQENLTEEQRREYLQTIEKKSFRLKVLIEDLFEVSKADSRNVVLNLLPLDIGNLIMQVYLEHQDKLDEQHLDFRFRMPEEKVILNLDSQKTYRIFENLYTNISKYAMPYTRVYLSMEQKENAIFIELKNISATELNVNPDDLTERFVRGDSSRNTEGSGLGLAIASSFVELQGGTMTLEADGDLFKVKIKWPL